MSEFQPITTQEALDAIIAGRINAEREKAKIALETVRGELKAAQAWKAEHEPRLARVAELEADIAKRDRASLFSAVGVTDEKQIDRAVKWYELVRDDFAEAERPDLATWLKDHAPNDPTIGAMFKKPATTATTTQAPPPNPNRNAQPVATPGAKLTPEQVKGKHAEILGDARKLQPGSAEHAAKLAEASAFLRTNAASA